MEEKTALSEMEKKAHEAEEKEFQDVLNELNEETSIHKFSVEYDKIFTSLKNSRNNEMRLLNKCADLRAEIKSNSLNMEKACKLSQADQNTILALKKELSEAMKLVDSCRKMQNTAEERIKTIQQELESEIEFDEQGAVVYIASSRAAMVKLFSFLEKLKADRNMFCSELASLRDMFNNATMKQNEAEEENVKARETISQLQLDIQEHHYKWTNCIQEKEKLGLDLKELQEQFSHQKREIQKLTTECQNSHEERKRLEQQLCEQKSLRKSVSKDLDMLKVFNSNLQQKIENDSLSLQQLKSKYEEQAKERTKEAEMMSQMKQEIAKITKINVANEKKLGLMEDEKVEVEHQRDILKIQVQGLNKEIDEAKKQNESNKKTIHVLIREKNILSRNILKAEDATEKQLNRVKLEEQRKKSLVKEIHKYQDDAKKQSKVISDLENERDQYIYAARDLKRNIASNIETIKEHELKITECENKLAETETKLKQQQNFCEEIRADRYNYSKNLSLAQSEISDLKYKMNYMSQNNDQLKEDVKSKEAALVREHHELQRTEKEKKALNAELQKIKLQAQENKQYMDNQEAEKNRLLKIIADVNAEKAQQKKELDNIIRERDICGSQLSFRNDERTVLSGKVDVHQAVLKRGEIEYNKRLEEINQLNRTVRKLDNEKKILEKTASRVKVLTQDLQVKDKELLSWHAKCQSLQQELENPSNIHRWVKLKESDPNTFELLQKTQHLQRFLLKKGEELLEQDLLIQKQTKLNMELKQKLDRQPGPEAAVNLLMHQKMLKDNTKHIKKLSAELNMYKSLSDRYKQKTMQLTDELKNMKKIMAKRSLEPKSQKQSKELGKKQGKNIHPLTKFGRTDMLTDDQKVMPFSGSMYKKRKDTPSTSSKLRFPPLAGTKVSLVGRVLGCSTMVTRKGMKSQSSPSVITRTDRT